MAHGRQQDELQDITLLGNQDNTYNFDYRPDVLESFDNKHQGRDYFVKFNCPEFTSLCPITGQPDFATIYISYIPNVKMVESKSLKLYLFSFRNHGDFHEDCMNIIMNDLIELMDHIILKSGASSHHVVEFLLILIQTMDVQILNMKKWLSIV